MIMIRTLRRDIARYNKEEEMVSKFNGYARVICSRIPISQTSKGDEN